MRVVTVAGHKVEQHSSPNTGPKMDEHKGIVLHIAEGTYRGTINWQMNPDQHYSDGTPVTTSSTWVVGREIGEVAQMVDTEIVAWCQRSGSYDWLSIELAGYHTQSPTPWQIEACADLLAQMHRVYSVPVRVALHPGEIGGLGHHSMDREYLGEEWGHEACPGAGVIAAKPAIVQRVLIIAGLTQPTPQPVEFPPGCRVLRVTSPMMSSRRAGQPDRRGDVCYVQRWVGATEDGWYGPKAAERVKGYQRMRGITVDGIVGPVTWSHMGVKYTGTEN